MSDAPSFYALEPKWLTSNRLYKVFATRRALCGAYLAGQVYDESSARAQILAPAGLLSFFLRPLVHRILAARTERERRADATDPEDASFLSMHRHNFRIETSNLDRVSIRRAKILDRVVWTSTLPASGTLTLRTRDGRARRFMLVGDQKNGADRLDSPDAFPGNRIN